MRTEQEVVELIERLMRENKATLNLRPAPKTESMEVGYKRTLTLISLNALYWVIKKERPKFKCEEQPN